MNIISFAQDRTGVICGECNHVSFNGRTSREDSDYRLLGCDNCGLFVVAPLGCHECPYNYHLTYDNIDKLFKSAIEHKKFMSGRIVVAKPMEILHMKLMKKQRIDCFSIDALHKKYAYTENCKLDNYHESKSFFCIFVCHGCNMHTTTILQSPG